MFATAFLASSFRVSFLDLDIKYFFSLFRTLKLIYWFFTHKMNFTLAKVFVLLDILINVLSLLPWFIK